MEEYEVLRERLEIVCNDLSRLQEKPEKYAKEIANLKEVATEIRRRMALGRVEKVSERISRRGR